MVSCPCGLPADYAACCGRYLDGGARPDTPEQLMRSRYTAYVRGDVEYLWATHHPDKRGDRARLEEGVRGSTFVRLVVQESGPTHVAFEAYFREGRGFGVLTERSRFVRLDERWVYLDGVVSVGDVGRNASCPCGSGQKYKRCCGA
jgi:SEC-C motif-containing protein